MSYRGNPVNGNDWSMRPSIYGQSINQTYKNARSFKEWNEKEKEDLIQEYNKGGPNSIPNIARKFQRTPKAIKMKLISLGFKFELETQPSDNLYHSNKKITEQKEITSSPSASASQSSECTICLDTKVSIALIPCGHTFCQQCVLRLDKCAICRKSIQSQLRIYMSN